MDTETEAEGQPISSRSRGKRSQASSSSAVGVSKKSPALIQPTGADRPAPPLQPTTKADVGDRSAKGIPMPERCSH